MTTYETDILIELRNAVARTPEQLQRLCGQAAIEIKNLRGKGYCVWTEDNDGCWHTGCGTTFEFTTGHPKENGFEYCFACGKSLIPDEQPR